MSWLIMLFMYYNVVAFLSLMYLWKESENLEKSFNSFYKNMKFLLNINFILTCFFFSMFILSFLNKLHFDKMFFQFSTIMLINSFIYFFKDYFFNKNNLIKLMMLPMNISLSDSLMPYSGITSSDSLMPYTSMAMPVSSLGSISDEGIFYMNNKNPWSSFLLLTCDYAMYSAVAELAARAAFNIYNGRDPFFHPNPIRDVLLDFFFSMKIVEAGKIVGHKMEEENFMGGYLFGFQWF